MKARNGQYSFVRRSSTLLWHRVVNNRIADIFQPKPQPVFFENCLLYLDRDVAPALLDALLVSLNLHFVLAPISAQNQLLSHIGLQQLLRCLTKGGGFHANRRKNKKEARQKTGAKRCRGRA